MSKIKKCLNQLVLPLLLIGCIGTDIIDDFVEPKIVIENTLISLKIDETYQFSAKYFNNIGNEEEASITWSSTNPEVMSITSTGLATALMSGTIDIVATSDNVIGVVSLEVGDETIQTEDERSAELHTVSSYDLSGTATLKKEGGKLILSFSSDFNADTGLPGLYVYLSNTTNTISNALEISAITQFSGAQSFEITETNDLFQYNIVLFYCKPFVVPVGNGTLNP